jgi:tight adherence protein C
VNVSLAGGAVGLAAGTGLLVTVARLPFRRRPRLEDRLAPYLRDSPRPSALLAEATSTVTPFPTLERVFRPVLADAARRVDRLLGGSASVRGRLAHAGSRTTLEQFRAQQVVCAASGAGAGIALLVLHQVTGAGPGPLIGLALTLVLGLVGLVARDVQLGRAVTHRSALISAELPTIAELLALAVAAGEGPVGALERVAALARGELADELGRALGDARAGATLLQSLRGVAERTAVPIVARFVDGIAIAIERGTPLADVLRGQAVDAREAGRRQLLEAGGRKEIAMLVPVVFLIMPIVVVFALYPGVIGISTIAH